MKFFWRETLRRMTGSDTACPVCKSAGLIVTEREERDVIPDIKGIPYCECPACSMRGEFPELVSAAEGRGLECVVRELYRIGEIEASVRDIDTYLLRKLAQVEVSGHMQICVSRLRTAPHKGGIRAGLSVATIRQLPPDTGLHDSSGAPRQFSILSGPRYSMVPLTLYRYRFDGETSCVDAQNPKTLQREHRIRITGDVGVYLGDFKAGDVPSVIVGTPNPRIAAQIYGAIRAETSLTSPVIGIAGFPLPHKFEAVRVIYLIDTSDSPLPLSFALRAVSEKTVYGTEYSPSIRILSPKCKASDITAHDIRALSNSKTHGKPILDWLSDKILANADRREEIANAFLQAGASENVRTEIADHLGNAAPKSLIDTIMLPTTEPDDVFTLGNGKMFKSTPVGIYTAFRIKKTGELQTRTLLCNVGLTVDSRIVDRGSETACCTVTHPDPDVPSISVRIPHSHWNNPDAIAEDVRAAYAECGRTPYVSFYRVGGYGWSDILQFLGSHCPVQVGLKALGATPGGDVNLPNAVISRHTISAQTKTGTLDQDALNAYSALDYNVTSSDVGALLEFLGSKSSLTRTGVAAGMLHALVCAAGKLFDKSGVRRPPTHLVFIETEPGVWDTTIRTLSYLFSGSEYVPLMDYGDRTGFLRHWSSLGTLPLITRLPAADDIANVLSNSPVSVIAIADPLTAVLCSGRGTFSFVLPNVETANDPGIGHDEIVRLRRSFTSAVADKAGSGWLDIGHGGPVSLSTPCLSALGTLTDTRGAESVAGGLYRSVKGRYPGIGLTGSRAFFGVLHRAYMETVNKDSNGIRITIVTGAPSDTVKASFNDRGEHVFVLPSVVLVSRAIVSIINREQAFLFDAEQLSREFEENGILLHDVPGKFGIDSSRVWAFTRGVWDEEVVRATGFKTRKEKYERRKKSS